MIGRQNTGLLRVIAGACILTSSLFAAAQGAAADETGESASAAGRFIYTESNSTGANFVLGYRIGAKGTFSALPDSPFATNGTGDGVRPPNGDSDHGVAISRGRFLLAANRGTNDVSVFRIHRDGHLTQVPGSPFPVGVTPVSIATFRDLVFVVDFGTGLPSSCNGCAFRGFTISESGALAPLPNAVFDLPTTSAPGSFSIRFSPNGEYLIATEFAASQIDVFRVERGEDRDDVRMAPIAGSPFPSLGQQPFGIEFNPANPRQLFVTNLSTTAFPPNLQGTVSSYEQRKNGEILPTVPVPTPSTGQFATCWVAVTHDGKLLFTSNTASGTLSSFAVSPDGELTLLRITPMPRGGLPATGLIGPVDMTITPDDHFLYIATLGIGSVIGFEIQPDGSLVPVQDPAPVTIPKAIPFGMVYVNTASHEN